MTSLVDSMTHNIFCLPFSPCWLLLIQMGEANQQSSCSCIVQGKHFLQPCAQSAKGPSISSVLFFVGFLSFSLTSFILIEKSFPLPSLVRNEINVFCDPNSQIFLSTELKKKFPVNYIEGKIILLFCSTFFLPMCQKGANDALKA